MITMPATPNPTRIHDVAHSHNWHVHGSDELIITRHEPFPHRVDVHFGSRGQVTYCALNGRQYSGRNRVTEVLTWLQAKGEGNHHA